MYIVPLFCWVKIEPLCCKCEIRGGKTTNFILTRLHATYLAFLSSPPPSGVRFKTNGSRLETTMIGACTSEDGSSVSLSDAPKSEVGPLNRGSKAGSGEEGD